MVKRNSTTRGIFPESFALACQTAREGRKPEGLRSTGVAPAAAYKPLCALGEAGLCPGEAPGATMISRYAKIVLSALAIIPAVLVTAPAARAQA